MLWIASARRWWRNLVGGHAFPDIQQAAYGTGEVVGMAGQRGGVQRPGRGAADDIERGTQGRTAGVGKNAGDRMHHTSLAGSARPAACKDQARFFR